jgi:DNA-binding response OmpR family regulator
MLVLLVDNDVDFLDITSYALRREGFDVITAMNGEQALRLWKKSRPDVILLDIKMPRMDGYTVLRRIREEGDTPVILVTALEDEEFLARGFALGADDYITKPCSYRELAWRIRAVARRAGRADTEELTRQLQIGDVVLDLDAHQVRRGEAVVSLTPTEFRLLHILAVNAGRVVPAGRLLEYACGYDAGERQLLKTHISHLRRKLATVTNSIAIVSVNRTGYRLVAGTGGEAAAPPETLTIRRAAGRYESIGSRRESKPKINRSATGS